MAVVQISRIQHRRGNRADLPSALNDAEFGWANDTRELFIGEGLPHGGNTQILTDNPNSIPAANYSYRSNTDVDAATGFQIQGNNVVPDPQFPLVRSLQSKLDDFVSVKDFGARGDFDIGTMEPFTTRPDDTGPLLNAMQVLYDDAYNLNSPASQNPNDHDPRSHRTLYFPAGVYRITRSLLLYPYATLIGDGQGKTIVYLDYDASLPVDTDSVARTVDSLGSNSSVSMPWSFSQQIRVSGITFQTTKPDADVLVLENVNRVLFYDCGFVGTRQSGDPLANGGSNGVQVKQSMTSSVFGNPVDYTFRNCVFSDTQIGFNCIEAEAQNILIDNCGFQGHYTSIKTGYKSGIDATLPFGSDTTGPAFVKVANCYFGQHDHIAWDVITMKKGCVSSKNSYSDNGVEPAVMLSSDVTNFVSTGDTFENTDSVLCADFSTSLRVRNQSTSDEIIIINAQDKLITGKGFCNISISGDLVLGGCIIFTTETVTVPAGSNPIFTATQSQGNVLFYEYGMKNADAANPGTVYRVGKVMVVHDGNTIVGFTHEYTDSSSSLPNPVTITANVVTNPDPAIATKIEIIADTGTIPNTTFVHSCRLLTL